jgi:hypothetical protein
MRKAVPSVETKLPAYLQFGTEKVSATAPKTCERGARTPRNIAYRIFARKYPRAALVDGVQAFDEMCRRIYVRARLADVREEFREKPGAHRVRTFVLPVNCLSRFIRKSVLASL